MIRFLGLALRAPALALPFGVAARHQSSRADSTHDVVIALGSNLGDRGQNLRHALRSLQDHGVKVLRHSALYETVPAYVADQPNYLNAALLARTALEPLQLLRVLKEIESGAGRDLQGGIRFGPRPLDLDIIFYGDLELNHDKLQIPHPRWHERSFVKAPVADLYRPTQDGSIGGHEASPSPGPVTRDPEASSAQTGIRDPGLIRQLQRVHQLWNNRSNGSSYDADAGSPGGPSAAGLPADQGEIMQRVMPLSAGRLLPWGRRTYVMAILNATPDSFSDGGALMSGGAAGALAAAWRLVQEGADILDVGGQSTKPGATRVPEEEEAGRVIPLIRAIKGDEALKGTLVSVDTFYASVARQAVAAGADIVNDVSGGSLDPGMMAQVAELGVPYVLMHMRGDPGTMQQAQHMRYGCTWRDVGAELQARADLAMVSGVAAWNIVLDPETADRRLCPDKHACDVSQYLHLWIQGAELAATIAPASLRGIGFAKDDEGNLELMRHLGDMRQQALQGSFSAGPLLVGPSRKGFLGRLAGRQQPSQRDAATLAAAVACVAGGGLADIVRVHNVRDTRDGLRVADALYRP